jgi:hypothetical protein
MLQKIMKIILTFLVLLSSLPLSALSLENSYSGCSYGTDGSVSCGGFDN